MKVRFLITLLACTVIFSCKKDEKTDDDDHPRPPGVIEFTPSTEIYADQAVMYTNNGTITDQAVIKAFLTRRGHVERFTFETPGTTVIGSYTMKLRDNGAEIGPEKTARWESSDDSTDVLSDYKEITPDNKASLTDTINNLINAYGPAAKCPDFYNVPCQYAERYILQRKGEKNYSPYIISLVSVTYDKNLMGMQVPTTSLGFYSSGSNGVVNSAVLEKQLSSHQTITIYDASTDQYMTTNRYDTTVVQVLKREMIRKK